MAGEEDVLYILLSAKSNLSFNLGLQSLYSVHEATMDLDSEARQLTCGQDVGEVL